MSYGNWMDEFEAAVDRFFETATDEQIDATLEKADAAFFNTIDTPSFRAPHNERQLVAAGGHSESFRVRPRSWAYDSEAVAFNWNAHFEEVAPSATSSAFASNDNFALSA